MLWLGRKAGRCTLRITGLSLDTGSLLGLCSIPSVLFLVAETFLLVSCCIWLPCIVCLPSLPTVSLSILVIITITFFFFCFVFLVPQAVNIEHENWGHWLLESLFLYKGSWCKIYPASDRSKWESCTPLYEPANLAPGDMLYQDSEIGPPGCRDGVVQLLLDLCVQLCT